MKRILAFFLTAILLLSLAACSQNVDPYAVTLAEADFEYTESTVALPSELSFKKMTVYEGDDYNIIIRSITPDSPEGYVLSVDISNHAEKTETTKTVYTYKTDDDGEKEIVGEEEVSVLTGVTYRFAVESAVVNGTKVDVSFTTELSADDRTFDQIILDKAALDGLGQVTEIQLTFKVYSIGETERLVSNLSATIYPYGDPDLLK